MWVISVLRNNNLAHVLAKSCISAYSFLKTHENIFFIVNCRILWAILNAQMQLYSTQCVEYGYTNEAILRYIVLKYSNAQKNISLAYSCPLDFGLINIRIPIYFRVRSASKKTLIKNAPLSLF